MKITNLKSFTQTIDLSKSYKIKIKNKDGKEIEDQTGKSLQVLGKKSLSNLPKEIAEEKNIKNSVAKGDLKVSEDDKPVEEKKKNKEGE